MAADKAVRELAEGGLPWAIPWPCLAEFLSVATHTRLYQPPSTTTEAAAQIDAWLEAPTVALLGEGPAAWPELRETLVQSGVVGPRVHDARIAAICQSHGVSELWTADRDFGRFPSLRTRNPLVGG